MLSYIKQASYLNQSVVEAVKYCSRLPRRVFRYVTNSTPSQSQGDSNGTEPIPEENQDAFCAICQATVTTPTHVSPCKHVFDKDCICRWMEQEQQNKQTYQNSCPTCRTPVEAIYCGATGIDIYQSRIPFLTDLEALRILQNDEEGSVPESIRMQVSRATHGIWDRILAQRETYVMTRDEFAIFNYYSHLLPPDNTIARNARARYWDSHAS